MRKLRPIALCLALLVALGALVGCTNVQASDTAVAAATEVFAPADFPVWFIEEGPWRAPVNRTAQNDFVGGFVEDASGRPSYEEIELMLEMAMLAPSAGGHAARFIVVVTDVETQQAIKQADEPGRPRAGSEGTVMFLIFGESLLSSDQRTAPGIFAGDLSPRLGYYDLGIVNGYLNVAAMALGYSTRIYATAAYPGVALGARWPQFERFLEDTEFVQGNGNVRSAENMKYAMVVVVGTHDPTAIDPVLESSTTVAQRAPNWAFWDPYTGTPGFTFELPTAELTDGVHRGYGSAYGGNIYVEVTIEDGVITSIEVVEHNETPIFLDIAQGAIISQILATQSTLNIDVVSGATAVSEGIVEAVANAIRP